MGKCTCHMLAAASVDRYIDRVDWRSRASLIKYRDAFRNSQTPDQTVGAKGSVVTARHQPEPEYNAQEASSDTGTASSITTSEPGISPRGDELDSSSSKVTAGDGIMITKPDDKFERKTDSKDNENVSFLSDKIEKEKSMSSRSEPSKDEPVVKVKDEVQKIENKTENVTASITSNQIIDVAEQSKHRENITDSKEKNDSEFEDGTKNAELIGKESSKTDIVSEADSTLVDQASLEDKVHENVEGAKAGKEVISKDEHAETETESQNDDHTLKSKGDEMGETDTGSEHIQKSTSTPKTSEKDAKQGSTSDFNTEEKTMSKENGLDLKIDKQLTPEKQKYGNASEIIVSSTETKENSVSEEPKIEKTEDKVLETKLQAEATEKTTKTKSETAIVELSPTKEKPQVIGELQENNQSSGTKVIEEKIEKDIMHEEKNKKLVLQTNEETQPPSNELSEEPVATTTESDKTFNELHNITSEKETHVPVLEEKKASPKIEPVADIKEVGDSKEDTHFPVLEEKEASPGISSKIEPVADIKEIDDSKEHVTELKPDVDSLKTTETDDEVQIYKQSTEKTDVSDKGQYYQQTADSQTRVEIKTEDSDISLAEKNRERQTSQPPAISSELSAEKAEPDNQIILGETKSAEDKSKVQTVNSTDPNNENNANQNEQIANTKLFDIESKSNDALVKDKETEHTDFTESQVSDIKTEPVELPISKDTESASDKTPDSSVIPEHFEKDQKENLVNGSLPRGTEMGNVGDIQQKTEILQLQQSKDNDRINDNEEHIKLLSKDSESSLYSERDTSSQPKAESPVTVKSTLKEETVANDAIIDNTSKDSEHSPHAETDISPQQKPESQIIDKNTPKEESTKTDAEIDDKTSKDTELHAITDTNSQPIIDSPAPKDENESSFHAEIESSSQPKAEPPVTDKSTPQVESAEKGPISDETYHEKSQPLSTETEAFPHEKSQPLSAETEAFSHEKSQPLSTETEAFPHEKSQPLSAETEAFPPLTNGVLESPTEEKSDAIPGASDGDGMLECWVCFSVSSSMS